MPRDYLINGESLVRVRGNTSSSISSLSELGLATDAIQVRPVFKHKDIDVDAWGEAPPEIQFMLAEVIITMNLIHFDNVVLRECLRLSMGGASTEGTLSRAGARMGGGVARFAAGYNFIGLNIASPVGATPWRFLHSYLSATPVIYPLGTEKSIAQCTWRAIPYLADPWNDGSGASGVILWDHSSD